MINHFMLHRDVDPFLRSLVKDTSFRYTICLEPNTSTLSIRFINNDTKFDRRISFCTVAVDFDNFASIVSDEFKRIIEIHDLEAL